MSTLLAATALSAAAQTPYPADAVLNAFSSVCASPSSLAAVRSQAEGADWNVVSDPNDRVSKILANGVVLGKAYPGIKTLKVVGTAVLRKIVEGRDLELAVDEIETNIGKASFRATGCYVYDLDAKAPIEDAILRKRIGRDPDESVSQAGTFIGRVWKNGAPLTNVKFEAGYAPPESPYVKQGLMGGVVLVSRQIEKVN